MQRGQQRLDVLHIELALQGSVSLVYKKKQGKKQPRMCQETLEKRAKTFLGGNDHKPKLDYISEAVSYWHWEEIKIKFLGKRSI